MYENNPQAIGELKAAITGKIRQIPKRTTFGANFYFFEKKRKTMQTDSGG